VLATNGVDTNGEQSQAETQDSAERISEALTHILHSPRFKDSPQLQSLLRYVVHEALKGNEDALKERIIGMNVFGRRPDYDTTDDPIVRSRMGLLRKRLAQYYDGNGGLEHPITAKYTKPISGQPAFGSRPGRLLHHPNP